MAKNTPAAHTHAPHTPVHTTKYAVAHDAVAATETRAAPLASNVRRVSTRLFSSSLWAYPVILRIRSAPSRLASARSLACFSSLSRSSTAAGDVPLTESTLSA